MKSVSIDQITAANLELRQKTEITLTEVLPPEQAHSTSLVFVSTPALLREALKNKAQALIMTDAVYRDVQGELPKHICIWTAPHLHAAMAAVLPLFDRKMPYLKGGIHPTAAIHPTAKVSATAHIGAHSVIEAFAVVGDDTIIFPQVYIGAYCEIGKRCYIAPQATIGSDGFGFYTDKSHTHHKIPQLGIVVIEDDCEIGSHCAIDRATLTETRIKKGSKLDNHCHVAHNVVIGENAMITAGFIVAGSTVIGKNLMTSGSVHMLGHLKVADNVILSARAGVLQSIEESGMYGGYPLEPHKESVKTLASIPHLKKIKKQVTRILRHLNLTEEG